MLSIDMKELIIREMKNQGKTYRGLAKEIGCSPRTITYWNSKESKISIDLAEKALNALGYEILIIKREMMK